MNYVTLVSSLTPTVAHVFGTPTVLPFALHVTPSLSQAARVAHGVHRASSASASKFGRFYTQAHHHPGGTITVKSRLMDGSHSDICLADWGDRPITCLVCGFTPNTAGQILLYAGIQMRHLLLVPCCYVGLSDATCCCRMTGVAQSIFYTPKR